MAQPPVNARGDEDPNGPTVMMLSYMRSLGMQPTPQNVRALQAQMARTAPVNITGPAGGHTMGDMYVEDRAAPTQSTNPGVGQSGNAAAEIEPAQSGASAGRPPGRGAPTSSAPPQTPMPQSSAPAPSGDMQERQVADVSSLPGQNLTQGPTDDRNWLATLGEIILGGGAGMFGMRRPQVPPYVMTPQLTGPDTTTPQLPAPDTTGDRYQISSPDANPALLPDADPLRAAISRATGGANVGSGTDLPSLPMQRPGPPDVINAPYEPMTPPRVRVPAGSAPIPDEVPAAAARVRPGRVRIRAGRG